MTQSNILPFDVENAGRNPAPLRYRPDIDGLRAVAVLSVVAYHAFPKYVRGGFVGVDIFFVISGYLITAIIYRQMREKRFSISNFYNRRIKRIFPALIVVVFSTFVIGWLVLPPREMESLGSNIAGGAAFAQNFVLLGQVGYFDLAADKKPLLHLWSLGIEEQYYIAWPLMLIAILRWARNVPATIAVLTLISFVICVLARERSAEMAFYLPITRAWELLIGSALAVWPRDAQLVEGAAITGREKMSPRYQAWASLLSLLAIVIAVTAFSFRTRYPGFYTIVPVAAAAVLIGTKGTSLHRFFLSCRPMVFVGLISYPLYLWHFPLMAYARILHPDGVPIGVMLSILVISGILAWVTYQLVERPIRFGSDKRGIKIAALVAGMFLVGIIGFAAYSTDGFPSRIPESLRSFMLTGDETSVYWRRGSCLLLPDQDASNFTPTCAGDGRRPLLLIWGDSYGAAFYPGLEHFSRKRDFDVAEFTASACPPLIGYSNPERRFCKTINDFVMRRIAELRPEAVILDSTWSYGFDDLRTGLHRTKELLDSLGVKKTVLMGPPANWRGDGLVANVLSYYFETRSLLPKRTFYRSNDEWVRSIDSFLQQQTRAMDIDYISTRNILCNDEGCLARIGPGGSQLTAFDGGHLTVPGSIFVAERALDRILDFRN